MQVVHSSSTFRFFVALIFGVVSIQASLASEITSVANTRQELAIGEEHHPLDVFVSPDLLFPSLLRVSPDRPSPADGKPGLFTQSDYTDDLKPVVPISLTRTIPHGSQPTSPPRAANLLKTIRDDIVVGVGIQGAITAVKILTLRDGPDLAGVRRRPGIPFVAGVWGVMPAVRGTGLDDRIQDHFVRGSDLPDDLSNFLDHSGTFLPVVISGAIYAGGLSSGNDGRRENGKILLETLSANYLLTALGKHAMHDTRPNGQDSLGFPSGHSSNSMAFASAVEEIYGTRRAAPLYALSIAVGYQRMDARKHHLSQVIAGWALGYMVGKRVTARHGKDRTSRTRDTAWHPDPYLDVSNGASGIMLTRSF